MRLSWILALAAVALPHPLLAMDAKGTIPMSTTLSPQSARRLRFHGVMGDRIQANVSQWLLQAPDANPAMLAMFRDREASAERHLLPWSGEFAGKYLISAVQALRLTGDPRLKRLLQGFVRELLASQDTDGYLGPFSRNLRFVGAGLWDLWGQYHVMLGLFQWYQFSGDHEALAGCLRAADLFCKTFPENGRRIGEAGSEEMNQSAIHIFPILYQETGDARYLRMAERFLEAWEVPPSGDFVRLGLSGKAFYQGPKPRWEGLHGLQALYGLHQITEQPRYRTALENLWWSIAEYDRHNTGGFSSGEQACGNPYHPGAIETCCTVAWMALTVDMLRMTGDPRVADELELSAWNGILGAQHSSGRWFTYNTPMDGERKASAHEIVFQARPGSPELNCCSVNGPRGLGMLADWAVMTGPDSVCIYYYGPMEADVDLKEVGIISILQDTDFPVSGHVRLMVTPDRSQRFAVKVRLPGWSRKTSVRLNGTPLTEGKPGSMQTIDRVWRKGDVVDIDLDMSPRLWVGEKECAGKVSVYHGPILMAWDPRFQRDASPGPELPDDWSVVETVRKEVPGPRPFVLKRYGKGGPVLCDFATAGATGRAYKTWLEYAGGKPAPFSRANPHRAVWP